MQKRTASVCLHCLNWKRNITKEVFTGEKREFLEQTMTIWKKYDFFLLKSWLCENERLGNSAIHFGLNYSVINETNQIEYLVILKVRNWGTLHFFL